MKELWKSPSNRSIKDMKSTTINPNGGWGKSGVKMVAPAKRNGKSKNKTLQMLGF